MNKLKKLIRYIKYKFHLGCPYNATEGSKCIDPTMCELCWEEADGE